MAKLNEIIEACQNGENLARKMLYEEYSTKMRAVCYRYLGNIMDTEDILHESFIIIFAKIGQYSGKGSFEGWLKRIVINTSLNFLKKKRKSTISYGDEMIEIWEQKNIENPISSKGEEKDKDLVRRMNFSKDELMEIMQQLPEGYKLVFNLVVFEKHTHKEVGELLSITEGTSRSQLNRARKYLQQELYKASIEKRKKEDNDQYKSILRVV